MASKLGVWNLALAHIRAPQVDSDTELSLAALKCSAFYDICTDMLLAEAPWKFATRWVDLPKRSPAPEGWSVAYQLPPKMLRIWRVRTEVAGGYYPSADEQRQGVEIPYDLGPMESGEPQSLFSNTEPLQAKITFKTDIGQFPPSVVMALSHLLSSYIAVPLAGVEVGAKLQKAQFNSYQNLLDAAGAADAMSQELSNTTPRFVSARF